MRNNGRSASGSEGLTANVEIGFIGTLHYFEKFCQAEGLSAPCAHGRSAATTLLRPAKLPSSSLASHDCRWRLFLSILHLFLAALALIPLGASHPHRDPPPIRARGRSRALARQFH